jgi:hypothetical protein
LSPFFFFFFFTSPLPTFLYQNWWSRGEFPKQQTQKPICRSAKPRSRSEIQLGLCGKGKTKPKKKRSREGERKQTRTRWRARQTNKPTAERKVVYRNNTQFFKSPESNNDDISGLKFSRKKRSAESKSRERKKKRKGKTPKFSSNSQEK